MNTGKCCIKCGCELVIGSNTTEAQFKYHVYRCNGCSKEYRKVNSEKYKEYQKNYRTQNLEKVKEYDARYRKQNQEKIKEYRAGYRKQNPEKAREYVSRYGKQNPGKRNALVAKRRAAKLNATLPGFEAEIRDIYLRCSELNKITEEQYHVDHIVPLLNENVCGLHVPWNLQIILASENVRKSNKLVVGSEEI